MTQSEALIVANWPTKLVRQETGCDYLEVDSGGLLEVKTKLLRPSQVREMVKVHESAKPCTIVDVYDNFFLIFKLEKVVGIVPDNKPTTVVCPKCQYAWQSRIPNPKECPECKTRLDCPRD